MRTIFADSAFSLHSMDSSRKGSQRSTPLADLSVTDAIARLSGGRMSHSRYFEDVLTRYEQCKFANAFVGPVDVDAFAEWASNRDARRRKFRHKLFGVPFVVKDSIDVAGIPTTLWCVLCLGGDGPRLGWRPSRWSELELCLLWLSPKLPQAVAFPVAVFGLI